MRRRAPVYALLGFTLFVPLAYPILRGLGADDALARSSWLLVSSTVALVYATVGLLVATIWSTRRLAKLQEGLAREKAAQEALYHRRQEISDALQGHFGADWRGTIRRMAGDRSRAGLDKVLQPFGTTQHEVTRFFPEVFRKASAPPDPDAGEQADSRTRLQRLRDWWRGA